MKSKHLKFLWPVAGMIAALCLVSCSKSDESSEPPSPPAEEPSSVSTALDVRLAWPEGIPISQQVTLNELNRLQLPGRPNPLVEQTDLHQKYSVVASDVDAAGVRQFELILDHCRMDVNVNGRSILDLNTASGPAATESGDAVSAETVMRGIVGRMVGVRMDPSNRVSRVSGTNDFKEAILDRLPPQSRSILNRIYNGEFFGQLVLPSHLRMMEKDGVSPGDTWSDEMMIDTGSLGSAILRLDFVFEARESLRSHDCARIRFQGSLTNAGEAGTGPMGMKTKIHKGDVAGRCWFSPELGLVLQSEVEHAIDMTMAMEIPRIGAKGGGTQTMSNQLKQTLQMQLLAIGERKL